MSSIVQHRYDCPLRPEHRQRRVVLRRPAAGLVHQAFDALVAHPRAPHERRRRRRSEPAPGHPSTTRTTGYGYPTCPA
ncbi:hypothetical protein [Streptomyces hokutonensis]|uniref:hypothetical protein n=1 Tax=Streptomyces hokutonensis TaxID=1306990 RepID=UPI001319BB3B|nr:hypothetical protein [Streptomyces hokutonensis]